MTRFLRKLADIGTWCSECGARIDRGARYEEVDIDGRVFPVCGRCAGIDDQHAGGS